MPDNFGLSENALKQFNDLYCFQNETIKDAFKRVAKEFATNDEEFDIAYKLLSEGAWRPNTPTWLNAGKKYKIFSGCYVVGLEDSMDSIYDIANISRKIFQYGSGVGIPIGNLREAEAYIYEGNQENPPEGKSSGPLTFMKLYNSVGETTKSGGRVRRAAILCAMPVWHPDIMDFISCKEIDGTLSNMNISVSITNKFMKALEDKVPFPLITPYDGSVIGEVDPEEVWDKIAEMAHKTADPGIIFIDNVQKWNTLKSKILIETSNPCVIGDTEITTKDGKKKLTSLSLSDKVLNYNIEKEMFEYDEIVNIQKTRENTNVIELEIEDDGITYILRCTEDHKIYTNNRGYIEANKLTEEDDIVVRKGYS